ncbi:OprD family outer membrane porin [Maridesulfovibrio zosterae]|uniref:OprD family outer membrane porin n=1 Tax=Maridesulfovibrio zosterae TaxID=82171 RepID=UPI000404C088|nr:OprD family outer membrane porin [Maridesulfovibrio zosterae]
MNCKLKNHLILPLALLFVLTSACSVLAATNATDKKEEWKYGKISGQVRMFYFMQEDRPNGQSFDKTKESFAIGGQLKYETPWIADHFGGVVTGFLAAPLFDDLNKVRYAGTGVLDNKNQGYAVVGEAYFKARYEKTIAKIWRQRIETPYINGNDSRLLPNTFEAYGVESTDIDGLKLHVAWVDKMKNRDSDLFISMTESAGVSGNQGGLVMFGADWKPTDKMSFRAWNYYTPDMDNTFFIEANYSYDISEALETHVKFQAVDQRNTGSDLLGTYTADEAGLLLGLKYNGMTFDVGGTIVDDSADVRNSWGVNPFFNNLMSCGFNRAGEKALYLAAGYDFTRVGVKGFSANVKTGFGSTPDSGKNASYDRNEYDLNLAYKFDGYFDGYLDGLSLINRWEYQDADNSMGGKDVVQVRVRLQYDF